MKLYLIRHGNTFQDGEQPVWVGRTNDLALVESGREQANLIGRYFKEQRATPLRAIYTGPLSRARETAEVLSRVAGVAEPIVDMRLDEIDYGRWAGLSGEEIRARFDPAALEDWEKQSKWATGMFNGSEEEILSGVHAFVRDILTRYEPGDSIAAVSSNGVLRYFLSLLPEGLAQRVANGNFKVRTGAMCLLQKQADGWREVFWNKRPIDFTIVEPDRRQG